MSDGPHRSLPMGKAWRELAKRGDQEIYDPEQVAEAAAAALTSDLKNEVKWLLLDALKAIFTGRDNSFKSPVIALQELDDAKALAAGSVFGMNAVACSIALINEDKFGLDAYYEAIGLAIKERGFAHVRQVEEHYLRKSNQRRADHVTKRLENAIAGFSEHKLGSMLAVPGSADIRQPRKMTNLDDGVPLQ